MDMPERWTCRDFLEKVKRIVPSALAKAHPIAVGVSGGCPACWRVSGLVTPLTSRPL